MAFDAYDLNRFFFNFDVGMTVTRSGGDWFERRNDLAGCSGYGCFHRRTGEKF